MRWTANLAYAIGLITTDGCLSKDGRHIDLTSKDIDQIQNFSKILKLQNNIGLKSREKEGVKKYFRVQFSNVRLYRFLLKIGLTPNKSKSLKNLKIPEYYFADFLRGCLDGDGNISIVIHPESKNLQLRIRIASASNNFLYWLKFCISSYYAINSGFIEIKPTSRANYLVYCKSDSLKLLNLVYYIGVKYYLKRKFDYFHARMGE